MIKFPAQSRRNNYRGWFTRGICWPYNNKNWNTPKVGTNKNTSGKKASRINSVTGEADTTTGPFHECNQKENSENVNKQKWIEEGNRSKETIDASFASTLPHNKTLAHKHDTIKVDSSASCSITFDPKIADLQWQDHQRTFKEKAEEANK